MDAQDTHAHEPALPAVYDDPEDFEERGTPAQLTALYAALAKARGEFLPIARDREVVVTMKNGNKYKFTYADLGVLLAATTPALSANGLAFLSPFTRLRPEVMVQRVILSHCDGARLVFTFKSPYPDGDDLKTLGGHQTYLTRYAYRSVLALAGGEDLDDMPQEAARGEHGAEARPAGRSPAPQAEPARRAPPAKPTAQPTPPPAPQQSNGTGVAFEELKQLLRTCGYLTLAQATARVTQGLEGEVIPGWHTGGKLTSEQIDQLMRGLVNERAASLNRSPVGEST